MIKVTRWHVAAGVFLLGCLLGELAMSMLPRIKQVYWQWIKEDPQDIVPAEQVECPTLTRSPIARFETMSAVADGKLYLFGGFVSRKLEVTSRNDVFDPRTGSWTRLADLPKPLTHAAAAVVDGEIWFAGGFVGNHPGVATAEVWRYDIAADRWRTGPALPEARAGGGLALAGGELHYFGGVRADRETSAGEHWSLSLDGPPEWRARPPMPNPRNHFAVAVWRDTVYAIGGQHGHDGPIEDVSSVHKFDPANDEWTQCAGLETPGSHFEPGTFVAGDRIVIAGGRSNKLVRYDIAAYDPVGDRWELLRALPAAIMGPVAKVIGEQVIIGTGGRMPTGFDPSDELISCSFKELGLVQEENR